MVNQIQHEKKIIIVGGGAAGLLAAISAAEAGAKVLILEKNDRLGKKLGITGKGRCNLTNNSNINELVANMPGNGKFLFSCFSRLDSFKTQEFFSSLGIPLKVERGKRVFPKSDRAADVIAALRKRLDELNVNVKYNQRAVALLQNEGKIVGVKTQEGTFSGDVVILATGGSSYPTTGSTGDGYDLAQKIGHKIIPLRPALIPLETNSPYKKDLQGLSLRNVSVSIESAKKVLGQEFGEMLFTHYGFSGPVVLSLSRLLLKWDRKLPLFLRIDLKPALSVEQLDLRLQRDFLKFKNKAFKNSLNELLPKSLIPVIIALSNIEQDKAVNSITREERQALVNLLKNLFFPINGTRPLAEAIVTAGGVSTGEIDPKTMESKLVKNLFFAGEVIDIDGYTGGYNLQAAFSTGYTAGYFAAQIQKMIYQEIEVDVMESKKMPAIAIDGPAGAGKSTIAKRLAERLSIPYLDTGAMYRALTYLALKNQVAIDDVHGLEKIYKDVFMEVRFNQGKQEVFIGGEDFTPYLRLKEVSELVSPLSAHPFIRDIMVKKQREIAARDGIVLDGRDIGTVVLPDAPLKIFLTASLEERTRRRLLDFVNMGIDVDFQELKEEIAARDLRDSTREIAPLQQAEDAYLLDSTELSIEEVVDVIINLLKQKNLLPKGLSL